MMMTGLKRYWWAVMAAALGGGVVCAQEHATTTQATSTTAPAAGRFDFGEYEGVAHWDYQFAYPTAPGFWPDLGYGTVSWFAAVVILALTIRLRPLLWVRNLDGLVLAGMCLLLGLRETPGTPAGGAHSWQWWAYLGLTACLVYWLLRGIRLLAGRKPMRQPGTVSSGVRLVLVAAGLALSIHQIATAPVSIGSRDGIVGGLFTAATEKLPYGDATDCQSRSPLLYLLHAATVTVVEPTLLLPDEEVARSMTWSNRGWWLAQPWLDAADLVAARLVNAVLFVGTLLGLYLIGSRLQTEGSGWTMVAIFCVFPAALECLPRPEVMLPALLLTWAIALALLPGLGGLLATLGLVFAGVAWPWAWLGLPILLAYCWRRGWQALGSTLGLIGGAALCLVGLATLVQPAIPLTSGALAMAGLQPSYQARLAGNDTVVIYRREGAEQPKPQAASRWLWRALVTSESVPMKRAENGGQALKIDWPNGVSGEGVLFRQIEPTAQALSVLGPAYREALHKAPWPTRVLVGARTVLEATWLRAGSTEPPPTGAWALWGGSPVMAERWILIRRIVKVAVAVLVVWATLAVYLGRRTRPRHLLGALLLTVSGALLASELGAMTGLVWLLPLATALWAVHEPPPQPAPRSATVPSVVSFEPGAAPRITVEPAAPSPPG